MKKKKRGNGVMMMSWRRRWNFCKARRGRVERFQKSSPISQKVPLQTLAPAPGALRVPSRSAPPPSGCKRVFEHRNQSVSPPVPARASCFALKERDGNVRRRRRRRWSRHDDLCRRPPALLRPLPSAPLAQEERHHTALAVLRRRVREGRGGRRGCSGGPRGIADTADDDNPDGDVVAL